MVVLETATALLGGPYAQGAPALKMVQKRYIGLHQWLGPLRSKELKEHIVSICPAIANLISMPLILFVSELTLLSCLYFCYFKKKSLSTKSRCFNLFFIFLISIFRYFSYVCQ